MTDRQLSRRTALKATGAVLGAAWFPVAASAGETRTDWVRLETPVDRTLFDVTYARDGAYVVGQGGLVLHREGERWRVVLDGGPTGNGNDLYGVATTDDGDRVWFVGASGAIGEYDADAGVVYDRSAPDDVTNNFNDVAVTGTSGAAEVYVAGDSGKCHYSFENGERGTWGHVTPGSGAALPAVDVHGSKAGHLVDTNGEVFATDDGVTWNAIGIGDANVDFYGVDGDAADDVTVVGGGGMVFDRDGARWVPTDLGDASLRDVAVHGDDGLAVGGGGTVFELRNGTWRRARTPTGQNLTAVARGVSELAVGAGGTVLER